MSHLEKAVELIEKAEEELNLAESAGELGEGEAYGVAIAMRAAAEAMDEVAQR